MKKTAIYLAIIPGLILLLSFMPDKKTPVVKSASPIKIWETEQVLKVPESVLYNDDNNLIYVSNINGKATNKDGNGFISTLTMEGRIMKLNWAEGLNAPKGMGIYGDHLYVSDIDRVAKINLKDGSIDGYIEIPGSEFLNDIAISGDGIVFVSDMQASKIYKIEKGEYSEIKTEQKLKRSNGLYWAGERLYIGNSGFILSIDPASGEEEIVLENTGSIDGLAINEKGQFIFSDWAGNVHLAFRGQEKFKVLDLERLGINAADIWYIKEKKILLVPTFFNNNVMAFQMP